MLSVSSMPTFENGDPIGPSTYGTTYIVRPRIEPWSHPRNLAYVCAGSDQLLVGPASISFGARDVVGIRAMQVAAGPFGLIELDEYSRGDRLFGEAIFLGFGTVAPHNGIGPGEQGDFLDPIAQRAAAGRRTSYVGIGPHFMHSTSVLVKRSSYSNADAKGNPANIGS